MVKRISKRISKDCKHFKYNKHRTNSTVKTNDWILKNRIRKENPSISLLIILAILTMSLDFHLTFSHN